MARTRHIAGVIGLWSSTTSLARLPNDLRELLARAAADAASYQRAMGPHEDTSATSELIARGMMIRDIDASVLRPAAERLWQREAQALGVAPWLGAILS
jgi:TRAP-type C4-dicarboxylate transport system substrate-binding protein